MGNFVKMPSLKAGHTGERSDRLFQNREHSLQASVRQVQTGHFRDGLAKLLLALNESDSSTIV